MGRPRRIDEAAVLEAARAVFLARGAAATTREVAEAAGVSQAVLFQRYRTKRRLYFAALLPRPPDLADLLGDPPGRGPEAARAHLVGLATRLLEWIDASMPGSLRAALHPDFPEALADAHAPAGAEALVRAVADRIRDLQGRGGIGARTDADAAASTLVELVHGQALVSMLSGNRESADRRAERAVALLWRGRSPPP